MSTTTKEKEMELESTRERLAFLEERRDALNTQVGAAREIEGGMLAAVEEARADLAEGVCTSSEVARLVGDAERQAVIRKQIEAALASVEKEIGESAHAIGEEEHRREKARQTEAALPLREEAALCAETFIKGVMNLTAPLSRHRELADQVSKDYPLAPAIPALSLDELAVMLREGLGPAMPSGGLMHHAARAWLVSVMAGPITTDAGRIMVGLNVKE